MQVGLTNSGSDAHKEMSRPGEVLKVATAFSGGTWAKAAVGKRQRAATSNGHFLMGGSHSGGGRAGVGSRLLSFVPGPQAVVKEEGMREGAAVGPGGKG